MRLSQRELIWGLVGLFALVVLVVSVEVLRTFVVAMGVRAFLFVKHHYLLFVATFILVKGKFVWFLFVKKMAFLFVAGVGKRYVTERVLLHHIKTHLVAPLKNDIAHLIDYISKHFRSFPIAKKIIAIFAFLGSISYVAKTMGVFLALKVILGKIWSFLLALFLKIGSMVAYFFGDYLWNSWITPIVEVVIFSWFFSLLERVPMVGRGLRRLYDFFLRFFLFFEELTEKVFHLPLRRLMRKLVTKIRKAIRKFTNMKHQSYRQKLITSRTFHQNSHKKIIRQRKATHRTTHQSPYMKMKSKRMGRGKIKSIV